jgi:hypothetical protein
MIAWGFSRAARDATPHFRRASERRRRSPLRDLPPAPGRRATRRGPARRPTPRPTRARGRARHTQLVAGRPLRAVIPERHRGFAEFLGRPSLLRPRTARYPRGRPSHVVSAARARHTARMTREPGVYKLPAAELQDVASSEAHGGAAVFRFPTALPARPHSSRTVIDVDEARVVTIGSAWAFPRRWRKAKARAVGRSAFCLAPAEAFVLRERPP